MCLLDLGIRRGGGRNKSPEVLVKRLLSHGFEGVANSAGRFRSGGV